MSLKRALLALGVLVLAGLACTVTVRPAPPKNPTQFVQVIYQYEDNGKGGVNIAFLVEERPDFSSEIRFEYPFNVEVLKEKESQNPSSGFQITVKDQNHQNPVTGYSDETGHIVLTTNYPFPQIMVTGWYCQLVGQWEGDRNSQGVASQGGLFQCEK